MGFPTTTMSAKSSSQSRTVALAAVSLIVLQGCKPAEQQVGDLHVLTVPSVYPWQASPVGSGVAFPALGKTLTATAANPSHSVEIVLDFPLHPGGFPHPQGVGSYGTIKIKEGNVRFVSDETYLALLPDKRVLRKSKKDSPELRLHYAPDSEYQIGISVGTLYAGGSVDEKGENAWDKCGIKLPTERRGEFVRVHFRVECSTDFDGDLGQWGVSQTE